MVNKDTKDMCVHHLDVGHGNTLVPLPMLKLIWQSHVGVTAKVTSIRTHQVLTKWGLGKK
jgi:hypothetical protein